MIVEIAQKYGMKGKIRNYPVKQNIAYINTKSRVYGNKKK